MFFPSEFFWTFSSFNLVSRKKAVFDAYIFFKILHHILRAAVEEQSRDLHLTDVPHVCFSSLWLAKKLTFLENRVFDDMPG